MKHSVVMLETTYASENGIHARHYIKGRSYTVSDHLLEAFIKQGVVRIDMPNNPYEYDPVIESPENKMDNNMDRKRAGRPKGSKNENKR